MAPERTSTCRGLTRHDLRQRSGSYNLLSDRLKTALPNGQTPPLLFLSAAFRGAVALMLQNGPERGKPFNSVDPFDGLDPFMTCLLLETLQA